MDLRLSVGVFGALLVVAALGPVRADAPPSPAAAASAAPSAVASTAASPAAAKKLEFTTSLTPANALGVYGGTLTLYLASDGSIKGTYRPEGVGPRAVTGTLKGSDIDLVFGANAYMEVTGTYADGEINGQTNLKGRPFKFHAVPKV